MAIRRFNNKGPEGRMTPFWRDLIGGVVIGHFAAAAILFFSLASQAYFADQRMVYAASACMAIGLGWIEARRTWER